MTTLYGRVSTRASPACPRDTSGTLVGMRGYLLSRLGQTAPVVFFLVRLAGDPVLLFLPMDIQAKDINETRQRLGFNDPLAVQYSRFVTNAARSASCWSGCPPP